MLHPNNTDEVIFASEMPTSYDSVKLVSRSGNVSYWFQPHPVNGVERKQFTSNSIGRVTFSNINSSHNSYTLANNTLAPLILTQLTASLSAASLAFTVLHLEHFYEISEMRIWGRNFTSSEFLMEEEYSLRSSIRDGHFVPFRSNWTENCVFRRLGNFSNFTQNPPLAKFIARQLVLLQMTKVPLNLVISALEINASRYSVQLVKRITHCGSDHDLFYMTRGQCIVSKPWHGVDPSDDPKLLFGDCYSTGGSTHNIGQILCNPDSLELFFTNRYLMRKISLLHHQYTRVESTGLCASTLPNPYSKFNIVNRTIYCFEHETFKRKALTSQVITNAIGALPASPQERHSDGSLLSNATFGELHALTYLFGDYFIIADQTRHVLRVIEGLVNFSSINSYTVCDASAAKLRRDLPFTNDLSETDQKSCILFQPYIVQFYNNKMVVVNGPDSNGQLRITSYFVSRCDVDQLSPEVKVIPNNGTIHLSSNFYCYREYWKVFTCAEISCHKFVLFNHEDKALTVELTKSTSPADNIWRIIVINSKMLFTRNLFWPVNVNVPLNLTISWTHGRHSLLAPNKSYQINSVTVNESEPYAISCEVTTPHPIKTVELKMFLDCTEIAANHSSSRVIDNVYERKFWVHKVTIHEHHFRQTILAASVPLLCGMRWKHPTSESKTRQLEDKLSTYALMYVHVHKKDCVNHSQPASALTTINKFINTYIPSDVQPICEVISRSTINQYCMGQCEICSKYCHLRNDYTVAPVIDHQKYTLSWAPFTSCFPSFKVTPCQLVVYLEGDKSLDCETAQITIVIEDTVFATGEKVSTQLNAAGWLTESIFSLIITVDNATYENDKLLRNEDELVYPTDADVPDLELVVTRNGKETLPQRGFLSVVKNEPVNVSCQIFTPHPIQYMIDFTMFIGCSKWQSAGYNVISEEVEGGTIYKHTLTAADVSFNYINATVAGFIPVLCDWRWTVAKATPPDFTRRVFSHLKITVCEEQQCETTQESQLDPSWFTYHSLEKNFFLESCRDHSSQYAEEFCVEEVCTRCDIERKPCFHGGRCAESTSTCDCTLAVGYHGPQCEEPIGLCGSGQLQCLYDSICSDRDGLAYCVCKPGYIGVTCSIYSRCDPNPCEHKWLICEQDDDPTNAQGYTCRDNKFIEDQVIVDYECYQDDSICNKVFQGSLCHPLGFCYCPDGTVKGKVLPNPAIKEIINNLAVREVGTACIAGKVKCRTQLDCSWVVDTSGETICFPEQDEQLFTEFLESYCTCSDKTRQHNTTGRCQGKPVKKETGKQDIETIESIPGWAYTLMGAASGILFVMLVVSGIAYSDQCKVDNWSRRYPWAKKSQIKKKQSPPKVVKEHKSRHEHKDNQLATKVDSVVVSEGKDHSPKSTSVGSYALSASSAEAKVRKTKSKKKRNRSSRKSSGSNKLKKSSVESLPSVGVATEPQEEDQSVAKAEAKKLAKEEYLAMADILRTHLDRI